LADTNTTEAQDAARYRWLRSQCPGVLGTPVPPGIFVLCVPENFILTEADADAAIDAAMEMGGH